MKNQNQQSPQIPAMRYPAIEKLIETEAFEPVNRSFTTTYEMLERFLKDKSGGLKKQGQIRQALKAYDLTTDLIKELLKVKQELLKNQKDSPDKKSPQKK
ncbi:hypothetical protein K1X76_08315 [bacterium]|nr:hypothetical protein [bacterium]